MIAYRPDIDGLRAVAVMMVILFHLGLGPITGGYIGVDVFFVISGYLITSIILKDIEHGQFSVARFYERRIKRILPALGVVIASCIVAAYFLLFPEAFDNFGFSIFSMALFGTNFMFWKESGYFAPESDLVPLLHTWSLSVEEQFYIVFPLFLILIYRYRKSWAAPLSFAGLVLSFLFCWWGGAHDKVATIFYLLPPRAWELFTGSMLAFGVLPVVRNRWLANGLGFLGFGFIVYAGLTLNDDTIFPGFAALWPVVGAALIIYSALKQKTLVSELLGLKPVVFVGKISYSLYLWHWPLIVFYNHASFSPLSLAGKLVILASSFVLAYLSWRFVEQPVRFKLQIPRKTLFIRTGMISLVFVALGLTFNIGKGLPWRFPEDIQTLSVSKVGDIKLPVISKAVEKYGFIMGDPAQDPSFVVWGDSHGMASKPGMHELAKELGKSAYIFERGGCMPALRALEKFEAECNAFNAHVFEFIKNHPEINRVVLFAFWEKYLSSLNGRLPESERETSPQAFVPAVEEMIAALTNMGREVYVVMDPPILSIKHFPLYYARARYYGREVETDTSLSLYLEKVEGLYQRFERLKAKYGFKQLFLADTWCKEDRCPIVAGDHVLYYDNDHISQYGSIYMKEAYRPLFK